MDTKIFAEMETGKPPKKPVVFIGVSADVSTEVSIGVSADVSTEVSVDVSAGMSTEVFIGVSAGVPTEVSIVVSIGFSIEVFTEVSAGVSVEVFCRTFCRRYLTNGQTLCIILIKSSAVSTEIEIVPLL